MPITPIRNPPGTVLSPDTHPFAHVPVMNSLAPLGSRDNPHPPRLSNYSSDVIPWCVANAVRVIRALAVANTQNPILPGVRFDVSPDGDVTSNSNGLFYYDTAWLYAKEHSYDNWYRVVRLSHGNGDYAGYYGYTFLEETLSVFDPAVADAGGCPYWSAEYWYEYLAPYGNTRLWIESGFLHCDNTRALDYLRRQDVNVEYSAAPPANATYVIVSAREARITAINSSQSYTCVHYRGERIRGEAPMTWDSYRNPTGLTPKKSPDKSRIVGVEIEVNGNSPFSRSRSIIIQSGCSVKHDGSCGWEVVTPPTRAADIESIVAPVVASLVKHGETADARCGLHVHVDARDLDTLAIGRLFALWSKVEPLFYCFAGQDRYFGQYSAPSAVDIGDPNILGELLSSSADKVHRAIAPFTRRRYHALNLTNWVNQNRDKMTIEYRLHRGVLDSTRIVSWARMLAAFTSKANRCSNEEVIDILKLSPLRAACKLLPKHREFIVGALLEYRRETAYSTKIPRQAAFLPGKIIIENRKRRGTHKPVKIPEFYTLSRDVYRALREGVIGEGCSCRFCVVKFTRIAAIESGVSVPDTVNPDYVYDITYQGLPVENTFKRYVSAGLIAA